MKITDNIDKSDTITKMKQKIESKNNQVNKCTDKLKQINLELKLIKKSSANNKQSHKKLEKYFDKKTKLQAQKQSLKEDIKLLNKKLKDISKNKIKSTRYKHKGGTFSYIEENSKIYNEDIKFKDLIETFKEDLQNSFNDLTYYYTNLNEAERKSIIASFDTDEYFSFFIQNNNPKSLKNTFKNINHDNATIKKLESDKNSHLPQSHNPHINDFFEKLYDFTNIITTFLQTVFTEHKYICIKIPCILEKLNGDSICKEIISIEEELDLKYDSIESTELDDLKNLIFKHVCHINEKTKNTSSMSSSSS